MWTGLPVILHDSGYMCLCIMIWYLLVGLYTVCMYIHGCVCHMYMYRYVIAWHIQTLFSGLQWTCSKRTLSREDTPLVLTQLLAASTMNVSPHPHPTPSTHTPKASLIWTELFSKRRMSFLEWHYCNAKFEVNVHAASPPFCSTVFSFLKF